MIEEVQDAPHIQSGKEGQVIEFAIKSHAPRNEVMWYSVGTNITIRYFSRQGKIKVPTEKIIGKTVRKVKDLMIANGFSNLEYKKHSPIQAELEDHMDISTVDGITIGGIKIAEAKDKWLDLETSCCISWKPKAAMVPTDVIWSSIDYMQGNFGRNFFLNCKGLKVTVKTTGIFFS